jgi:tetratricopeptide (TPR) repeat protein
MQALPQGARAAPARGAGAGTEAAAGPPPPPQQGEGEGGAGAQDSGDDASTLVEQLTEEDEGSDALAAAAGAGAAAGGGDTLLEAAQEAALVLGEARAIAGWRRRRDRFALPALCLALQRVLALKRLPCVELATVHRCLSAAFLLCARPGASEEEQEEEEEEEAQEPGREQEHEEADSGSSAGAQACRRRGLSGEQVHRFLALFGPLRCAFAKASESLLSGGSVSLVPGWWGLSAGRSRAERELLAARARGGSGAGRLLLVRWSRSRPDKLIVSYLGAEPGVVRHCGLTNEGCAGFSARVEGERREVFSSLALFLRACPGARALACPSARMWDASVREAAWAPQELDPVVSLLPGEHEEDQDAEDEEVTGDADAETGASSSDDVRECAGDCFERAGPLSVSLQCERCCVARRSPAEASALAGPLLLSARRTDPVTLDALLRRGAEKFRTGQRAEAEQLFKEVLTCAEENLAYHHLHTEPRGAAGSAGSATPPTSSSRRSSAAFSATSTGSGSPTSAVTGFGFGLAGRRSSSGSVGSVGGGSGGGSLGGSSPLPPSPLQSAGGALAAGAGAAAAAAAGATPQAPAPVLPHDGKAAWCKCLSCASLRGAARALGNLGHLLSDKRRAGEAVEMYRLSLPVLRELGMWKQEPIVLSSLVMCATQPAPGDATLGAEFGLDFYGTITQEPERKALLSKLDAVGAVGELLQSLGLAPKPLQQPQQDEPGRTSRPSTPPSPPAGPSRAQAAALLREGDAEYGRRQQPAAALAAYKRSLTAARLAGDDALEVSALIRLGCCLHQMARSRDAVVHFERAVLLLRSNNLTQASRESGRARVDLHNLALALAKQATAQAGK